MNTPKNIKASVSHSGMPQSENHPQTATPYVLTDQGITPRIGQLMRLYGQSCKIVAVHDFGTVDVESPSGRYWWRVTGLPFLKG